ncbi:MAG: flagellar assembly protein FliX [Kiloniellales bacterium]
MKIDQINTARPAAARSASRGAGVRGGGFAKALTEEQPSAAVTGAGRVTGIEALLTIQEVPDAGQGRARARRRGEDLLDRLDELRLALLSGGLSLEVIERLAALVASRRAQVDDPGLIAILDEIELRAAVELAKLGR